jgi:hypothetical protein
MDRRVAAFSGSAAAVVDDKTSLDVDVNAGGIPKAASVVRTRRMEMIKKHFIVGNRRSVGIVRNRTCCLDVDDTLS